MKVRKLICVVMLITSPLSPQPPVYSIADLRRSPTAPSQRKVSGFVTVAWSTGNTRQGPARRETGHHRCNCVHQNATVTPARYQFQRNLGIHLVGYLTYTKGLHRDSECNGRFGGVLLSFLDACEGVRLDRPLPISWLIELGTEGDNVRATISRQWLGPLLDQNPARP